MIQKIVFANDRFQSFLRVFVVLLPFVAGCASRPQPPLPDYQEFIAVRQKSIPDQLLEIYGRYSAKQQKRSVKSDFNLLLHPGKNGYLEILDPAKQLRYAVSVDRQQVTLLWAKDQSYLQEPSTPSNLRAIMGLALFPDDLLLLIAGYGLNFPQWTVTEKTDTGWVLKRDPFTANVVLKEDVTEIRIHSPNSVPLIVGYDRYAPQATTSLPQEIEFKIPARNIALKLSVEKYVPRDDAITADLFVVKLPQNSKRLPLETLPKDRPILLQ